MYRQSTGAHRHSDAEKQGLSHESLEGGSAGPSHRMSLCTAGSSETSGINRWRFSLDGDANLGGAHDKMDRRQNRGENSRFPSGRSRRMPQACNGKAWTPFDIGNAWIPSYLVDTAGALAGDGLHRGSKTPGIVIAPAEIFVAGRSNAPHAVRICIGMPRQRKKLDNALDVLAEILLSLHMRDIAMV